MCSSSCFGSLTQAIGLLAALRDGGTRSEDVADVEGVAVVGGFHIGGGRRRGGGGGGAARAELAELSTALACIPTAATTATHEVEAAVAAIATTTVPVCVCEQNTSSEWEKTQANQHGV